MKLILILIWWLILASNFYAGNTLQYSFNNYTEDIVFEDNLLSNTVSFNSFKVGINKDNKFFRNEFLIFYNLPTKPINHNYKVYNKIINYQINYKNIFGVKNNNYYKLYSNNYINIYVFNKNFIKYTKLINYISNNNDYNSNLQHTLIESSLPPTIMSSNEELIANLISIGYNCIDKDQGYICYATHLFNNAIKEQQLMQSITYNYINVGVFLGLNMYTFIIENLIVGAFVDYSLLNYYVNVNKNNNKPHLKFNNFAVSNGLYIQYTF